MQVHHLFLSQFLRRALCLSPALIVLYACGEKDAESSNRSKKAPPALAKPQEHPRPGAPRKTEPSPPLPADLQELLALLTPSNASRFRDQLRADPARWATCVSPFYRAWGKLDSAEALRAAAAEGTLSLPATLATIEGWTAQSPRSAREFVSQQDPPALRRRFAVPLIKAWPAEDLRSLANWSLPDPSLLSPITLRWSRVDPPAAARWLVDLPASPQQMRATESLFRLWTNDDPQAAGKFLLASREFSQRDRAIAAFASTVTIEDPESARQWAQEISDAELRQRILRDAASLHPRNNNLHAAENLIK